MTVTLCPSRGSRAPSFTRLFDLATGICRSLTAAPVSAQPRNTRAGTYPARCRSNWPNWNGGSRSCARRVSGGVLPRALTARFAPEAGPRASSPRLSRSAPGRRLTGVGSGGGCCRRRTAGADFRGPRFHSERPPIRFSGAGPPSGTGLPALFHPAPAPPEQPSAASSCLRTSPGGTRYWAAPQSGRL